jgi:hypothetical protein
LIYEKGKKYLKGIIIGVSISAYDLMNKIYMPKITFIFNSLYDSSKLPKDIKLFSYTPIHNRQKAEYNIIFTTSNGDYQLSEWINDNDMEDSYSDGNLLYIEDKINNCYLLDKIMDFSEIRDVEELIDKKIDLITYIPNNYYSQKRNKIEYTDEQIKAIILTNTPNKEKSLDEIYPIVKEFCTLDKFKELIDELIHSYEISGIDSNSKIIVTQRINRTKIGMIRRLPESVRKANNL